MKSRGATIQGALALTGLVAAYATWQREPDRAVGSEVVVLDLGRGDLERVRYDDGSKWLELQRRASDANPSVSLRLGSRPTAAPDGGAPPDGGVALASAKQATLDREVIGNDAADKLLEKFTPLRAARALGVLDDAKMQELGLAESKKRVEVTARGGKRTSYLLASSALGANAPYLENEQDKKVYLLGSSILSDLDAASTRLVDRRLHTFKAADYDSVLVRADNKQREFVQSSSEPQQTYKLAPRKNPDKPDEFARNWHDKIWQMIVTEVLGKGEAPASGEPAPAFKIEYRRAGKSVGWLELAVGRAASGTAPDLYARTEHTAGWDKVHAVGEDLLKEAKKVVSEER